MNTWLTYQKRLTGELDFWLSPQGKELQLCLMAQGYKEIVFVRMMTLMGSGFPAITILKQLEEEIENEPHKNINTV